MTGWIKLHRKILECELWKTKKPFDERSAWIDLLLMANHEDKTITFNGAPMEIKAGQTVTSLYKLADRWGWSRDRVRRYLALLTALGMTTRESDSNKTIVTLVNYGVYQDSRTSDTTSDNTSGNTSDNTQTRNIRNKEDKKNIYGDYRHVKLSPDEIQKLKEAYGEDMVGKCITYLDEYIEMKGYKAKSHYLCIKRWVVDAVKEKQVKGVKKDTWDINRPADDYADLIKALEDKK